MSVFFVGDLHLGHRTILKHSREAGQERGQGLETSDEHDEWCITQCLSVRPNKCTLWYILGDVAMNPERLCLLDRLPGRKILVLGNHDVLDSGVYLKHFERLSGGIKKYGMWITHMPLARPLLYGHPNIHGHNHKNELGGDSAYLNACIEWLPKQRPIELEYVRKHFRQFGFAC